MMTKFAAVLLLCCTMDAGAQSPASAPWLAASDWNPTSADTPAPSKPANAEDANSTATLGIKRLEAGAVTRSLAEKVGETVSVKDFGAICDGNSHPLTSRFNSLAAAQAAYPFARSLNEEIDGVAIQAAINSFTGNITGGIVYINHGICRTSSTLTVGDRQNMYVRGDGVNATVIKPATGVNTALLFGNTGTANQGVADLTIDCSDAGCDGVREQNVNTFFLDKVSITRPHIGINVQGGVIEYITNFVINAPTQAGVYLHGGNDQYLMNGVISSVGSTQPTTAGVWSDASGAFWMLNVDAISAKNGLLITPGDGQELDWLFVMNCAFDTGSGSGINIAPTGTGLVKGSTFIGNWTSSNSGSGVNISGTGSVDGLRFIGHRSFNNSQSGYSVESGNFTNLSFNDSDASGNSINNPGQYPGFNIGAGIAGFSISNSRAGQQAKFPNSQSHGIQIRRGGSDNYLITGNDLRGNMSTNLVDLGDGSQKIVSNNLGYNPIDTTEIRVGRSPFAWTNNTGGAALFFLTGGAVSNVTVDGRSVLGNTNGMVVVPQGSSAVVTYTRAPAVVYRGM